VLFHDPARTNPLPHSTGLAKGQVALVHAFASAQQQRQNAVVIAHELLHVFGAGDKYDPATLQPQCPDGYAEPDRDPRHPQLRAEIMGGRIALDERRSEIPATLDDTVIGPQTARNRPAAVDPLKRANSAGPPAQAQLESGHPNGMNRTTRWIAFASPPTCSPRWSRAAAT
jgi:hypothetical protein